MAIKPSNMGNQHKDKDKDAVRVNEEIRVSEVRLIGADGEMIGVVSIQEALRLAEEASLDLAEISPNAEPPVCKILDYGKYRYELQKKKAEAKKKQKVIEVKELKLKSRIGENDYQVKLRAAERFLNEQNKVKFSLRFKGREINQNEFGLALLDRFKNDLEPISKIELPPKFEGTQVIMILSSNK